MIFIYYKSKKLKGWVGMGEVVDTIPSIPNKCLFVSPDGQTDRQTDRQTEGRTLKRKFLNGV